METIFHGNSISTSKTLDAWLLLLKWFSSMSMAPLGKKEVDRVAPFIGI